MDSENCPYDRCLSLGSQTKWGVGVGTIPTSDPHTRDATGYFQTEISPHRN